MLHWYLSAKRMPLNSAIVENNITYVYVSGGIEANDDNAFSDYIKNLVGQSAVFVLNSPGGNVVAGIKIGIRIREMGWVTVVPSGLTCASACGLIWHSGATGMSLGTTYAFIAPMIRAMSNHLQPVMH